MITIVDYGVGNLFSLESSFRAISCEIEVTNDKAAIGRAEKLVLPGVGAFRDASRKLKETGIGDLICEKAAAGTPVLGVCLGMQLLFDKSYEYGEWEGLGLIRGEIRPISEIVPKELKIPHMGWNALHFPKEKHPLFRYLEEGDHVYFVHSYSAVSCEESLIASVEYGGTITAAAAGKNVCGCQFHPEKSGRIGLKILEAFAEM